MRLQVPPNFELVYIGGWSRLRGPPATLVHASVMPYTAHAFVLSQAGARRLHAASVFLQGKARPETSAARPCDGACYSIYADNFLLGVHENLLTDSDRSKWVAFESTADVPARWRGHSWTHFNNSVWAYPKCHDRCAEQVEARLCRRKGKADCPGVPGPGTGAHLKPRPTSASAACAPFLPLKGTGLAFQHTCKMRELPSGISTGAELLELF